MWDEILFLKWIFWISKYDNSPVQVVVSRHLMSSQLISFLRWLLMRCLLVRNLLTFSMKRSLMNSLLAPWCMNLCNDVSRLLLRYLLMRDFFVEKVSSFLMSRHFMSSHLKKKIRWLLMRCLLTTTWTGLIFQIWSMKHLSYKYFPLLYINEVFVHLKAAISSINQSRHNRKSNFHVSRKKFIIILPK